MIASQKLEAVGQLSGGIAHDFDNLMMIVLGNIETAERNSRHLASSKNLQHALANAKRGAQRAAALTSRLLAFSRRQALDPKPINLNNFINGSQEFLQRTLGERIEVQTVESAGLWHIEAMPTISNGHHQPWYQRTRRNAGWWQAYGGGRKRFS